MANDTPGIVPDETAAVEAPQAAVKVTFQDGKTIEFNARTKSVRDVDEDKGEVTFYVRTGKMFKLALSDVSDSIEKKLALHGISQKVGDSASGLKDDGDIEEAFGTTIANLLADKWAAVRESSGFAGSSILALAVARVTGKDIEAVKATLRAMSDGDKKALSLAPKVVEAKRQIEDEKRKAADPKAGEDLLAKFA